MIKLSMVVVLALAGCSDKQPTRVAWLSVEKPPIKVIYIDKQGQLDPAITSKVFEVVWTTPFRDVSINENTNISMKAESYQSDIESDTDTNSLSVTRSP